MIPFNSNCFTSNYMYMFIVVAVLLCLLIKHPLNSHASTYIYVSKNYAHVNENCNLD